jgi:hypothetical protein
MSEGEASAYFRNLLSIRDKFSHQILALQPQLTKPNKSFAVRYMPRGVNTGLKGIIATMCV